MEKKTKPTSATAATSAHTSRRSRQQPPLRQVQKFLLVWLDAGIDEVNNKDSVKTILKLREIVDNVHTFTNTTNCIQFIANTSEGETFMILSGAFGQTTVPIVHDMAQVNSIYIFCGNKSRHEQWAKQWPKVKGVYTDIKPICEALQTTAKNCDSNSVSISITASTDAKESFDKIDPNYIYSQILKEIMLTIDFEQRHINDFILYCREMFAGNKGQLKEVDELERNYYQHTPLWWYTRRDHFLYSMLNKALRTMNVNVMIKLGFFMCDLHKQIVQLHSEQSAQHHHSNRALVYRAQRMSATDFDHLRYSEGGLISFNNFLSTTRNLNIALKFTRKACSEVDHVDILFVMQFDASKSSVPFADIQCFSDFPNEAEILFSMHSLFRIRGIKKMDEDNRLWEVNLTLISDHDLQIHGLIEYIREESFPGEVGWYRLGQLLIKTGHFDTAQEVYQDMLSQTPVDYEKVKIYQQLGIVKLNKEEYTEAIQFSERSLLINSNILPPDHLDLANSHNIMGSIYGKMGEYMKALASQGKALRIFRKSLPPDHPQLATSYGILGEILNRMGEYPKALLAYEKAFKIQQNIFPSEHPTLAMSYNNIGEVYDNMGNYSNALSFYERALKIGQYSLPPDHPHLQTYEKNIESLKKKM